MRRLILIAILIALSATAAHATITCHAVGAGFCCDGDVAASPTATQVFAAQDVGPGVPRNGMLVQNLEDSGGITVYCDFLSTVTARHGFKLRPDIGTFSWNAPGNTPNAAFYCTGDGGTAAIHGCDN